MIDIHCHILPGADDGAARLEDTLNMARQAVNQGITTIIATPHHKTEYENRRSTILQLATEMNKALDQAMIPLTILPGQEIRIYGELMEDYKKGEIMPLAGSKYLLVELPSGHVPRYTERLLYDLQLEGFVPIIAHPERNREIVQNPEILYNLVDKGALSQLTAASLCGAFGSKIKKFALSLIEMNLTHFVASDAHNLTYRRFLLMEAFQEIESFYEKETVHLFKENAKHLIEDKTIHKEMPQRIKRKKFLGIF